MKKNILVTGGGGFIGSHLVEKLVTQGHNVKTIVPYSVDNSWGWMTLFQKNRETVLKLSLEIYVIRILYLKRQEN